MTRHLRRTVLIALTAVLLWQSSARPVGVGLTASRVQPLFDLTIPSGGPFPSDRFTMRDLSQNTGVRVNLPKPDCAILVFDCVEIEFVNELDGFHIQPRVSIPFSGPIDPSTVNGETVFLLSLGSPLTNGDDDDADDENDPSLGGRIVGLNQVVWDIETNSLHGEREHDF